MVLHLTKRRKGEVLMAIAGIGLAIGAMSISVPQVAYAGLCITGLGIVSMLWRQIKWISPILVFRRCGINPKTALGTIRINKQLDNVSSDMKALGKDISSSAIV